MIWYRNWTEEVIALLSLVHYGVQLGPWVLANYIF